jgi:NADPH:quinone reductase-like Zn-dependent oxidoreductase
LKAVVYNNYGSPDVLKFKDVKTPTPNDNEVLVKIKATSINSWDWDLLTGIPYEYRFLSGLLKPKKNNILGCDIAGCIESVGKNVTKLKLGDEVFGDLSDGGWGGFAEYVCADENELALKPANISFAEAAASLQAGLLALQAFQKKTDLKLGDRILINGACGGVGTFAIQIARTLGVEITAVDCTKKLEMMTSLGADHVIDYTKEDFTKNGERYDLILDVKTDRSIFDYKRVLTSNGVYVTVGGKTSRLLQLAVLGPLIKKKENKLLTLIIYKPNKDINKLCSFIEAGKVKPVIDKCFQLSETADAFRYFGQGHFKGKVVVVLDN